MFGITVVRKKTLAAIEKDRDSADAQVARLLHCRTQLTLLWTAVQASGHEGQIGTVYKRLSEEI